jgi:hypothetical protein
MATRTVLQRDLRQGAREQIAYTITTTPWCSAPVVTGLEVLDSTAAGEDVTATVLPGQASVLGDAITLPLLRDLEARHRYRVSVRFTAGGNTFEVWFEVVAEQ